MPVSITDEIIDAIIQNEGRNLGPEQPRCAREWPAQDRRRPDRARSGPAEGLAPWDSAAPRRRA